ncbi:hypothetical protein M422DRAFT_780986 [Sphaerobolus stellatus SS14]|uniref:Uncharacterized protein n=1 Tax=Sphaerobolus stellatus (strain SS14) TaxID=990650 RepID=A0A0C9VNB8_SPHS4|nr:hypothetical protein M422DRAFT_780986 [Sphaerobolus stellatus SS14]
MAMEIARQPIPVVAQQCDVTLGIEEVSRLVDVIAAQRARPDDAPPLLESSSRYFPHAYPPPDRHLHCHLSVVSPPTQLVRRPEKLDSQKLAGSSHGSTIYVGVSLNKLPSSILPYLPALPALPPHSNPQINHSSSASSPSCPTSQPRPPPPVYPHKHIVRLYFTDLVGTAASSDQGSSKEWMRVQGPPHMKLVPRYSDEYRKRMDLPSSRLRQASGVSGSPLRRNTKPKPA